jgi:hypothetical protein
MMILRRAWKFMSAAWVILLSAVIDLGLRLRP